MLCMALSTKVASALPLCRSNSTKVPCVGIVYVVYEYGGWSKRDSDRKYIGTQQRTMEKDLGADDKGH